MRNGILKLYHAKPAGNTSDYWNDEWKDIAPAAKVPLLRFDPLFPFFTKYLSRRHPNLEGGCGPAYWVLYWQQQGYGIVGLDFARETIARVRAAHPNLHLVEGDVNQLPFRDGEFGFYYSGGVVEHFEPGPMQALREARRVLRSDGTLMITVPDLTPLRRWLYRHKDCNQARSFGWRWVDRHQVESPPRPGDSFFQYVYPEIRFRRLLADAGFRVIESHGVYLLHGLLFESMLPGFLQDRPGSNGAVSPSSSDSNSRSSTSWKSRIKGLAKRFLVQEQASGMLLPFNPILQLLKFMFSNMRLYICKCVS